MAKTKGSSGRTISSPTKVQPIWQIGMLFPDGKKLVKNKCTLNELFNTYQMQIDSMVQMNQRNEMKDIEFKRMCITFDKVENNLEEMTVTMEVTCRDYIVQMKDGKEKVIRGKESYINDYIYSMTFVRNIKKKTTSCPNCGSVLNDAQSSICPSCKAVVIHETENWVLTKKKMLEQSRR